MATDSNHMDDDVHAVLNPDPDTPPPSGLVMLPEDIPPRPSDSAVKADWVDYVEALGGDRGFLENGATGVLTGLDETYHAITEDVPAPTKADLIDIADRLGG